MFKANGDGLIRGRAADCSDACWDCRLASQAGLTSGRVLRLQWLQRRTCNPRVSSMVRRTVTIPTGGRS